jgi:putative endonuclease
MGFHVYIMASGPYGALYIGQSEDLPRRVAEHRLKLLPGAFTAKYDVTRLVWFEELPSREAALIRERRIKEWRRAWKIELIEAMNPQWEDLYARLDLPPPID